MIKIQTGGMCHVWLSPDRKYKRILVLLDLTCALDQLPGIVILTNSTRTAATAREVLNLARELPALRSMYSGLPDAYWLMEQSADFRAAALSELSTSPLYFG